MDKRSRSKCAACFGYRQCPHVAESDLVVYDLSRRVLFRKKVPAGAQLCRDCFAKASAANQAELTLGELGTYGEI